MLRSFSQNWQIINEIKHDNIYIYISFNNAFNNLFTSIIYKFQRKHEHVKVE